MPFGADVQPGGGARFRLYAPGAACVELLCPAVGGAHPMQRSREVGEAGDGWFVCDLAHAAAGLRYAFRIDGALVVPDPASRCNPEGVHAASALVDPRAFHWTDGAWCGRPWHEAVLYELHVGCFTREGTFAAAIGRLDDLVALGVTAIELMPVAAFSGRRGWGYDGVLLYAPHAAYGAPEDLKGLVAAAHARGLMVLLDVVYNHFGPDGNYLHAYARPFFHPSLATPWGPAINFDGDGSRAVRDFFVHNALYWVEEFHLDGLRVDAVHAMHDRSALHFADELALRLRAGPGRKGWQMREVHLVLENHANDAARLQRAGDGRARLADAQWNDDLHHAAHVLVTGETDGYYADYAHPHGVADGASTTSRPSSRPVSRRDEGACGDAGAAHVAEAALAHLGRALAEGFAYQGEASRFSGGRARGTPSAQLPPLAFVNALQTHDQVGNRAFGERLGTLADEAGRGAALRALQAIVLLAPAPPMLFMGEEFAASSPFLYFCDFDDELGRAVTAGRRGEFGRFAPFADPALRERIPDPNAPGTFARSRLDWSECERGAHAHALARCRALLRCRASELVPRLAGAASGTWSTPEPGTLRVTWPLGGRCRWHLLARLAPDPGTPSHRSALPGRVVFSSAGAADRLPPWSVHWSVEAA
ncbi:MAG: malto-oligosyltrehalose trehalohydrolase [Burkholderiales bacterium]|nr:malto-oligosyltrehalose trehalohydrolase [Burkholderiales bacterium]